MQVPQARRRYIKWFGNPGWGTNTSSGTRYCNVFRSTDGHIYYIHAFTSLCCRGQESAGIVTTGGGKDEEFAFFKGRGQVSNVFNDDNMAKLKGKLGIGHTRYSTAGGTTTHDFQPFIIHTIHGVIAIAHNGQLINSKSLRKRVKYATVVQIIITDENQQHIPKTMFHIGWILVVCFMKFLSCAICDPSCNIALL